MRNQKNGLIIIAISALIALGLLAYIGFFLGAGKQATSAHSGNGSTGQTPGGGGLAQAFDAKAVKDPWQPSEAMVSYGQKVYGIACAMCHGADGKGEGPAATNMNPKPRNLVEGKWKKSGDRLGLFAVITGGLPASSMAGFQHLPVNDRWALVHYIQSITQNKVLDDDQQVAAKAVSLQ